MASDIWYRTIQIAKEETCCRHMGYSFRLAARVLLYAPSPRQDSTYHSLCYTSHGALAGTICCKKSLHFNWVFSDLGVINRKRKKTGFSNSVEEYEPAEKCKLKAYILQSLFVLLVDNDRLNKVLFCFLPVFHNRQ